MKIEYDKELQKVAIIAFMVLVTFVVSFSLFKNFAFKAEPKTSVVDSEKGWRDAAQKLCGDEAVADWKRESGVTESDGSGPGHLGITVHCGEKLENGVIVQRNTWTSKVYGLK